MLVPGRRTAPSRSEAVRNTRKVATVLLSAVLLAASGEALGQDVSRDGLIADLGSGLSYHRLRTVDERGFATIVMAPAIRLQVRFGYGLPGARYSLVSWTLFDVFLGSWVDQTGRPAFPRIGLSAIGGRYFVGPAAPSRYFVGGIGMSSLGSGLDFHEDDRGLGAVFGIGREFKPHIGVEGNLMASHLPLRGPEQWNVWSFSVSIAGLLY